MSPPRSDADADRVVTTNRRAWHDYFIDETLEAGVVLTGTEIKSIRAGKITLSDGFARVSSREAWLENVYVAPYDQGARENPDPRRRRKLLLHRRQIAELGAKTQQKGLTLVPLKIYLKAGRAKVELGLARGKHTYDKRHALAEREAKREVERALNARE